jgi:hypothetical protein
VKTRPKTRFSTPQLTIFIVAFALIGYLIIRALAASNPNLPGDLNNDNTVNISDLSIMLSDYGTTDPTKIAQADIDNNGKVDILDMSTLLSHFGQSVGTTSPDNTVINGTSGKIVDSNGHAWAINSAGQVTVDGIADISTANVTTLAYEAGKVWQKNTSNLWWYKVLPTDSWAPSAGTSVSPIPGQQQTSTNYLRGVNLSTFGYMTSTPTNFEMIDSLASLQYLKSHGVDLVRIPVPWGRLQPILGGPLDTVYYPKLKILIARCAQAGIKVVIDEHSNGGWGSNLGSARVGGSASSYTNVWGPASGTKGGITQAQAADFWLRISADYKNDPTVLAYDLVNEPVTNALNGDNGISKATYQSYQQYIVTALRNSGDNKQVWVEGINSSQPQGWAANNGAPWITDPANNIVYSMHTYPTTDFNGNSEYSSTDNNTANYLARIDEFESWRKQYGVKASVGETGWPSQQKGAPNTWQQYNSLGEAWFKKADQYGYTVTMWQASAAQDEGFDLYVPTTIPSTPVTPTPILSVARSNTTILQAHPSK